MPFDLAERIANEDHAAMWAEVIALGARNGVEDLHAAGAFTDDQAPVLNWRLRGHTYEVLIALRSMDSRRDDDPFTAYLIDVIDDRPQDPLRAALGSAIANAMSEFADAEGIDVETAERLTGAAVDGALEVVDLLLSPRSVRSGRAAGVPDHLDPLLLGAAATQPIFKAMLERGEALGLFVRAELAECFAVLDSLWGQPDVDAGLAALADRDELALLAHPAAQLVPEHAAELTNLLQGLDLLERLLLDSEDLIVGDRAVEHRKRVPIVDATGHYANLVLAVPGGGSPRATPQDLRPRAS